MPEGTTGSTVPRRQLGRHLRDLRNQAGLTVRAAARALEWSEPKIWRIETGQTSMRSLDVEAVCRIYGADSELTHTLMELAKETKARGWWHTYGDAIPDAYALYLGLEEAATELTAYQPEIVPDLLQTAAYARCVILTRDPGVNARTADRRVQVRARRQEILRRTTGAPRARFVVNEGVLHRRAGDTGTMLEQLDALVGTAALPTVELRVMPYAAGLHLGMLTGGFTQLRFPTLPDGTDTEPPAVFVENLTETLHLEKPDEIDQYAAAFDDVWNAALDATASTALITRTAAALRDR